MAEREVGWTQREGRREAGLRWVAVGDVFLDGGSLDVKFGGCREATNL